MCLERYKIERKNVFFVLDIYHIYVCTHGNRKRPQKHQDVNIGICNSDTKTWTRRWLKKLFSLNFRSHIYDFNLIFSNLFFHFWLKTETLRRGRVQFVI